MDHKLRAFLSVAKHGNFSRAAEALHMSQPAVSQQIQSLEQDLGVKLFERNTKRVSLTRAGRVVEHYGLEMERSYTAMERRLEDLTDVIAGPLSIGASYTVGEYVLPYAVATFCNENPNVRPSIQISNTLHLAKMVQNDAFDVGIVEGTVDIQGVSQTELMFDTMVVIAGPSHPAVKDASVLNSAETTWILREEGSGTREAANRVLDAIGVKVQSKMEFSSTQAIKASVQAGLGVSVLSELVVQRELELKTLVVLPVPQGDHSKRPFYLLQRESAFIPRVAAEFRHYLLNNIHKFVRP